MIKAKSEKRKAKNESGYSVIELMVAVGVFATVIMAMSGTLAISLRGQGKSATMQNVADNTRYAMEVIAKEIRMGSVRVDDGYVLDPSLSDIQFRSNMPNRNNAMVRFYLDDVAHQIMFDDDMSDGLLPEPITSANIAVNGLTFDVSGAVADSQPRVTITIQAVSSGTADVTATHMDLQTTISPRSL